MEVGTVALDNDKTSWTASLCRQREVDAIGADGKLRDDSHLFLLKRMVFSGKQQRASRVKESISLTQQPREDLALNWTLAALNSASDVCPNRVRGLLFQTATRTINFPASVLIETSHDAINKLDCPDNGRAPMI